MFHFEICECIVFIDFISRQENQAFESQKWDDEDEYYNDRPGASPPSPGPQDSIPPVPPIPEYKSPSNRPVSQYF